MRDYYTKTSVDTKLSKQVNYLYDIDNKLNTIAINKIEALDRLTSLTPPLIDIQSNTRVIGTLNVSNDLTVANINVLNSLNDKAPKASPTFSGTATASNLTVSTNLLIGTTNVMASLNSKANTSDVYTRTQIENALQPKIASFTAPLKYTENILSGINSLSIDSTVPFPIGDIECSGTLSIDTIEVKLSDHITVNDNLTVLGNVDAEGDISCRKLTITEFHPIKPYAALYVQSNAISTSTAVGYLAPSNFTMTHATGGLYSFTFTPAHPNGNNFQIFVTPRTSGTATAFFVCTAKVETDSTAGTKFTVWCRNASNTIVDGDFFVHTVP